MQFARITFSFLTICLPIVTNLSFVLVTRVIIPLGSFCLFFLGGQSFVNDDCMIVRPYRRELEVDLVSAAIRVTDVHGALRMISYLVSYDLLREYPRLPELFRDLAQVVCVSAAPLDNLFDVEVVPAELLHERAPGVVHLDLPQLLNNKILPVIPEYVYSHVLVLAPVFVHLDVILDREHAVLIYQHLVIIQASGKIKQ